VGWLMSGQVLRARGREAPRQDLGHRVGYSRSQFNPVHRTGEVHVEVALRTTTMSPSRGGETPMESEDKQGAGTRPEGRAVDQKPAVTGPRGGRSGPGHLSAQKLPPLEALATREHGLCICPDLRDVRQGLIRETCRLVSVTREWLSGLREEPHASVRALAPPALRISQRVRPLPLTAACARFGPRVVTRRPAPGPTKSGASRRGPLKKVGEDTSVYKRKKASLGRRDPDQSVGTGPPCCSPDPTGPRWWRGRTRRRPS